MNKLKFILHRLRVICGGGYMVCINKGCDEYHGVTSREFSNFVFKKYSNDLVSAGMRDFRKDSMVEFRSD